MSRRLARTLVLLAALLGALWGFLEWQERSTPGGAAVPDPAQVQSVPVERSPVERVLAQAEAHDPAAFDGARALLAGNLLPEERADLHIAAARGALAAGRPEDGNQDATAALALLSKDGYMPAFSGNPDRLRQEALLLQSGARIALGRGDADAPLLELTKAADPAIRLAARETLLTLVAARLGPGPAVDAHAEALLEDERVLRGRPYGQTIGFIATLEAAAGRDATARVQAAKEALGWNRAAPPRGLTPTGFEVLAPAVRLERLRGAAEAAAAAGDRAQAASLVLAAAETMRDLDDRRGAFETYGRAIALADGGAADAVLVAAAPSYLLLGGEEVQAEALLTNAQRAAARAYGPASSERAAMLLALADAAARQGLGATEGQALQNLALVVALSPNGPDVDAAAAVYARLAGVRAREGRRPEADAAARAARALAQGTPRN